MARDAGALEVVAVGFTDPEEAAAAEADLRAVLDVGESDLSLADIGGSEASAGLRAVLAARIRESRIPEVHAIVGRYGGTVLTEIEAERADRAR